MKLRELVGRNFGSPSLVCQCGPWAKLWWGLWGTKSPEAEAFLATRTGAACSMAQVAVTVTQW